MLPNWVRGTIKENSIAFPLPQFMGEENIEKLGEKTNKPLLKYGGS